MRVSARLSAVVKRLLAPPDSSRASVEQDVATDLMNLEARCAELAAELDEQTRLARRRLQLVEKERRERDYWVKGIAEPNPIIVHQMGKVGSRSIEVTLKDAFPNHTVFHTHYLNRDRLARRLEQGPDFELLMSRLLSERIYSGRTEGMKIVTAIREPIGRNLSAFFQNLESFLDGSVEGEGKPPNVEAVVQTFVEQYPHRLPLTWLDEEIRDVFGVDLYERPFAPSKGYEIYEGDGVEILLVRVDDLSRVASTAFGEFFGREGIELRNANVGVNKRYSELYKRVDMGIVVPRDLVDVAYSSRYSTHFWSEEEIDGFRKRWLRQES